MIGLRLRDYFSCGSGRFGPCLAERESLEEQVVRPLFLGPVCARCLTGSSMVIPPVDDERDGCGIVVSLVAGAEDGNITESTHLVTT